MRPVILDKSFLQAVSRNKFRELSEQYQFLMPDVLFYELISSKLGIIEEPWDTAIGKPEELLQLAVR